MLKVSETNNIIARNNCNFLMKIGFKKNNYAHMSPFSHFSRKFVGRKVVNIFCCKDVLFVTSF